MTKLIGNSNDGYKLVDEFGADNWASFAYNGPGGTFANNFAAAQALTERVDMDGGWTLDITYHQANARWDVKRGQIVTDVVTSLKPLFAEIASAVAGISPERFAELIEQGLDGVVVKAEPISAEDVEAIATATREAFRADPLT